MVFFYGHSHGVSVRSDVFELGGNVCFSESFESLSEGIQGALWALGGVPSRHRKDLLIASVNNLTETREFTVRYGSLMDHYGLEKERIQARQANENGDGVVSMLSPSTTSTTCSRVVTKWKSCSPPLRSVTSVGR